MATIYLRDTRIYDGTYGGFFGVEDEYDYMEQECDDSPDAFLDYYGCNPRDYIDAKASALLKAIQASLDTLARQHGLPSPFNTPLKFVGLDRPREYNFRTDWIVLEMTDYNYAALHQLINYYPLDWRCALEAAYLDRGEHDEVCRDTLAYVGELIALDGNTCEEFFLAVIFFISFVNQLTSDTNEDLHMSNRWHELALDQL